MKSPATDKVTRSNDVKEVYSNPGYEVRAVALMAVGFGLVGLDRFMINAMFPVIAADLGLGYQDIGTITGVLAVAWGVSAFFIGNLSDHIGRRRVLAGSLVLFSLLIGASGLATGLGGLLIVRAIMGFADGAYTPASISATLEASPANRHGRNLGIQQMMLPLFGLGLAPILVTQLLQFLDWRLIFPIFTLPGLLVAWLVWRVMRDQPLADRAVRSDRSLSSDLAAVFRVRNIRLLMLAMLCWLTCLITTSAFLPSYLMDHLGLTSVQMGFVMSAIGLGATVGTLTLPWLSDRIGRRPVMMLSAVGGLVSLALLSTTASDPGLLFAWLFATHFFTFSAITLTVGPISAESAPPFLMATASGMVIGVGEIFGGGLAPILAGFVADRFGIDHILWLPMAALGAGFLISWMLAETAPGIPRRRATA